MMLWAAGKSKDNVAAVVDVRRAFFNAEPLPKTFVELPDHLDIDTRTRCCEIGNSACTEQDKLEGRGNDRETVKAAGVIGKMSKCSSSLHAGICRA